MRHFMELQRNLHENILRQMNSNYELSFVLILLLLQIKLLTKMSNKQRQRSKGKRCQRAPQAPPRLAPPQNASTSQDKWENVCQTPQMQMVKSFKSVASAPGLLDEEDLVGFRLDRNVTPRQYTICLKPNLDKVSFDGCVAIGCEIAQESPSITLNSSGLNIRKVVWVDEVTNNRREPFQYTTNTEEQRLKITFDPPLAPNPGNLIINFNGTLDAATSFHTSRNILENSGVAVAKFTPAEARKCFPCFDEPSLKATFGLSFVIPRTVTVVSNMPIKLTYPHRSDKMLHSVEFETTPKMSPYLLTFGIGNFTFLEERISRNLTCRIYDSKILPAQSGKFAFETCKRLFQYFTEFFGVPFPLKKFDMLAERNGPTGAMGSWGLSIVKRGMILGSVDNAEHKLELMRTLANVICKQWLGNMVTEKWWTHFWLFEGLDTFMEYRSVDQLEPSRDMWMHFLTDVYMKALEMDALSTSHMVEIPINHPSELKDVFDSLSCRKGAAILRMLEAHVGSTKFQEGLSAFLRKYAYGNATSNQFWSMLEEISGKSIQAMMVSWTKQIGFPLVRVVLFNFENNCRNITLHQEPFYSDSTVITDKPNGLWIIPITVSTGAHPNKVAKEVLMDQRTVSFKLSGIVQSDWFKLNYGTTGYYRVKYPVEMQVQFRQAIRQKNVPALDRFGLLSDNYALAASGISSSVEVFTLLESLDDEENLSIWTLIDSIIHGFDLLLQTTDYLNHFLAFVKLIYKSIHAKLGWDGLEAENFMDTKLRRLVITRLLNCGDEKCESVGRTRFENLMSGQAFLPDQLPIIYRAGMQNADSETLRAMIRRLRVTDHAQEREDILGSFGFCKNRVVIREVLNFSISEYVSPQDTNVIMKSFASNVAGRKMAWEFFKERHPIMTHRSPPGSVLLNQLLQVLTEPFSTDEMSLEISEFFRIHQHHFLGSEHIISESLDKIHVSAAWLKREKLVMEEYLAKFE